MRTLVLAAALVSLPVSALAQGAPAELVPPPPVAGSGGGALAYIALGVAGGLLIAYLLPAGTAAAVGGAFVDAGAAAGSMLTGAGEVVVSAAAAVGEAIGLSGVASPGG